MTARSLTAVVAAAALALPAAAMAATDHDASLADYGATATWTSTDKTGAVYGSTVTGKVPVPHCSQAWSCDTTLVHTDRYGNLTISLTGQGLEGHDQTLSDIDLHVYNADADGNHDSEPLGEGVGSTASESVLLEDLPAGYYYVLVDWYLGAGHYIAQAQLDEPTDPADPAPEQPPVQPATGTGTPPSRQQDIGAATTAPFTWTSGNGAGSTDATNVTGKCTPVSCDFTLFHLTDPGILSIGVAPGGQTVADLDVQLYESNETGWQGPRVAGSTSASSSESIAPELDPGYYLLQVETMGAGTYNGTASWSLPEEDGWE